jgi:hypothetical protein
MVAFPRFEPTVANSNELQPAWFIRWCADTSTPLPKRPIARAPLCGRRAGFGVPTIIIHDELIEPTFRSQITPSANFVGIGVGILRTSAAQPSMKSMPKVPISAEGADFDSAPGTTGS